MRDLVVDEWMSLDGVVQAPGAPGEDTSGNFQHGGWHLPYFDDPSRKWVVEGISSAGAFLFGRVTYQNLATYWPHAPEEEQVIAEPLNSRRKYVASRTLTPPLEWENATLLEGEAAEAVARLKEEDGDPIHVIGSPVFVHGLMHHDLVDEFRLMIDPLALGGGKKLFPDDGRSRPLEMADSQVTTTGAMLLTYRRTRNG